MHPSAASDDRDIARDVAVDERATGVNQCELSLGAKIPLQMERPGRDLHGRTLSLAIHDTAGPRDSSARARLTRAPRRRPPGPLQLP